MNAIAAAFSILARSLETRRPAPSAALVELGLSSATRARVAG